ncbi:MAG: hypothetical protein ABEJ92_00805 [Halobacteriales archaeon]
MTGAVDADPEALQTELERIKDAMGLRDRYPSQFGLWLVYGALVLAASLSSQLIVLRGLAGWWHAVAWFVLMGAGGLYSWRRQSADRTSANDARPNVLLQGAAVAALYVVFAIGLAPVLDGVTGRLAAITIFSLVVGLVGTAYLVTGESLKAYFIRRRDRYAFYFGGAWMLVLAAIMPNVPALRTWGYTVFGVAYAIHAVVAYVVLSR